ncbi:unnamed protein product [Closterium sp. NIES-64]|nr:unnamed protein product [Closterium sp. NIES-64]
MARNAETVVYVVDTGPSVPQSVFQECRLWVEQQMVQKVRIGVFHECRLWVEQQMVKVGLGGDVWGWVETNNPLEEVEGYENIAVVVPHRVVDPSSLQAVHAMEQAADSSIRSDCNSFLIRGGFEDGGGAGEKENWSARHGADDGGDGGREEVEEEEFVVGVFIEERRERRR